jgi:uncharacterized protein involved in exopolysaccharide biosynthesis
MQTVNIIPEAKPAATANDKPSTPLSGRLLNLRALLRRRSLWLVGALLLIAAGAFGYH